MLLSILLQLLSLYFFLLLFFLTLYVITCKYLINKIFSLILVFVLLAFWLLLNNLEFLSLIILLLYIGAIAVLFLFIVMILNPDFLIQFKEKEELLFNFFYKLHFFKLFTSIYNINFINCSRAELQLYYDKYINEVNKYAEKNLYNMHTISFYSSSFFLGLFCGIMISTFFYWHTYIGFNFNIMPFNIYKLKTVYTINFLESFFSSSIGLVNYSVVYADLFYIKFNSYFLPLCYQNTELSLIGLLLYTKYGIGILLIGFMLLIAMIGVILLSLPYKIKNI